MKAPWAILCEKTVTDRDTNRTSLFNIVSEVAVPVEPPDKSEFSSISLPIRTTLVTLWERSNPDEPEAANGRVRLVGPNGKELTTSGHDVNLQEAQRGQVAIDMPKLTVMRQGQHIFKIEAQCANSDWQEMLELPLSVVIQVGDFP